MLSKQGYEVSCIMMIYIDLTIFDIKKNFIGAIFENFNWLLPKLYTWRSILQARLDVIDKIRIYRA
jgi:hypothetical protein